MAAPEDAGVWVGLDVGKEEHFADVLDNGGERLFARAVANDQADLEALLDRAARHGTPGLVIDQPGSIAQLALAVAARLATRKRAEGKRHNAALICLARRRCDVILAMLRTGQPYQPARHAAKLADAA